jgi:hypothetical protein
MNVLAGCDFFTVDVLTWRGLVTYYVLFFLHLESRRVSVAGAWPKTSPQQYSTFPSAALRPRRFRAISSRAAA